MTSLDNARTFFREAPWHLWTAQLLAVLRIELRRTLFKRRSLWLYLLSLGPVLLVIARAVNPHHYSQESATILMGGLFQLFYLRLSIFFGCMGLFTWMFRGEIVEKSLHYYFLSPVRREVVVLGKFLAGVITTGLFYGLSVALSFLFLYAGSDSGAADYILRGGGLSELSSYLGITLLACMGYGALFMTASLFIKNPIIPGMFLLAWETMHPVFPSMLQKLSVMFYLRQLCPVPVPPEGFLALFSVVVEPVSPWFAVPGLIILVGAILCVACLRIRRMEISYVAD